MPIAKTRADLFSMLDQMDIKTKTLDHPAVFTVEQAHEFDAALPGGHTKNLFLKDAKDRLFLVVAHTKTQVNLKLLPAQIGSARVSFGKPELLEAALGVTPGSVTVFALINDADHRVTFILDEALMAFDTIYAHPLENTGTTGIARRDLLRFIEACGHHAQIVQLQDLSPGATPPP